MSTESPDAGASEKEIFPVLTPAQIERIRPLGHERSFQAGDILWEQGETNRPLMLILEGEIEILSDRDTFVTIHRPGNFSGDVDMIAGHPAVVRARARRAGRILEVPAERVRSVVMTDPELSQILLRAFILRRTLLMSRSSGQRRPHRIEALGRNPGPAGVPDAQQPAATSTSTSTATRACRRRSSTSAWAWTTCPSSSAAASGS